MIHKTGIKPRQVFLIDGLGAIVSISLLTVLMYHEYLFGMPRHILLQLIPLAVIFSLYSFACYFINPEKWKNYLLVIALTNFLYCCLTLSLMFRYFEKLTIAGIIYFTSEKIIVLSLVFFELKLVAEKIKTSKTQQPKD